MPQHWSSTCVCKDSELSVPTPSAKIRFSTTASVKGRFTFHLRFFRFANSRFLREAC